MAKHSGEENFRREELLEMARNADQQEAAQRRIAGKLGDDGKWQSVPKVAADRPPSSGD